MDISSWFKWLPSEIPVPLQWLAWFLGFAVCVSFAMWLLRTIFGRPKLKMICHDSGTCSYLRCTILNMPIKNKFLRLIGVKREIDNFNVIYHIGKENSRTIICSSEAYDGYKPLPASEYFGAEFDIKPSQCDTSWFEKKGKPLDDGRYTILFKILHDNNETEMVKTFGVHKIRRKVLMTWLSEDRIMHRL